MSPTPERTRYLILGAHLQRNDAAIEGVAIFTAPPLHLSAMPYDGDLGAAAQATVLRASTLRRELIGREIFVAFRYGFSVGDEHEARRRISEQLPIWRELLEKHRGRVEMTLRTTGVTSPRPDRHEFTSGKDYLRALFERRKHSTIDPGFKKAVEEHFVPLAFDSKWIDREDGARELVMLLERASLADAASRGQRLKHDFPDIPFLLSGPWPLEVFADEPR